MLKKPLTEKASFFLKIEFYLLSKKSLMDPTMSVSAATKPFSERVSKFCLINKKKHCKIRLGLTST